MRLSQIPIAMKPDGITCWRGQRGFPGRRRRPNWRFFVSLMAGIAGGCPACNTLAMESPPVGLIQAQVDAAIPGQTIEIPAGVYTDHIVINKDLTLRGTNATETIVDGAASGSVFVIG